MSGVSPEDLFDLADELLNACIEALDTIPDFNPSLEGAPPRAFVAPGRPAADCCPQLTVHSVGITEDQIGAPVPGRSYMTSRLNQVTLAVTLFRCAPSAETLPTQAEMTAVSTQTNADGWALWNHLYNMIRNAELFSECGETKFGPLTSLPPEGGCVGWYWPIEVRLDGYVETPSS